MSVPGPEFADDAPFASVLDAAALRVAQEELHEDPKERLEAVRQLREWLHRQPHITSRTDTPYLVRFLRGAKFSQLRAREMLDGYLSLRSRYPLWFTNIDTRDPKIHYIISKGYLVPLPGRDRHGRRVILQRTGSLDPADKTVEVEDILRTQVALTNLVHRDEVTQVYGVVMLGDHTGATLKHMMRFPLETTKAFMKTFQKNMPGRFKAFHVYNGGAVLETMMPIMKPILSSKFLNRMHVHSTLESVYGEVPMEMLPEEYLPDDYSGPRAGSLKQITDDLIAQISTDEFRNYMFYETAPRFKVDDSKRPKDANIEGAFRKLNVD